MKDMLTESPEMVNAFVFLFTEKPHEKSTAASIAHNGTPRVLYAFFRKLPLKREVDRTA